MYIFQNITISKIYFYGTIKIITVAEYFCFYLLYKWHTILTKKDSKDSYDDSYKHYNINSTFSYIYIYITRASQSPVISRESRKSIVLYFMYK